MIMAWVMDIVTESEIGTKGAAVASEATCI